MVSYIILEVADEEHVSVFLEDTRRLQEEGPQGVWHSVNGDPVFLTGGQENTVGYKVIGVYRKPTLFCTCIADGKRTDSAPKRFTRGKKYGWYVCRTCGKPPKLMLQRPRNLILPAGASQAQLEKFILERGWWHPENASFDERRASYEERPYLKPTFYTDSFTQVREQGRLTAKENRT